jgi:hypothetical protein
VPLILSESSGAQGDRAVDRTLQCGGIRTFRGNRIGRVIGSSSRPPVDGKGGATRESPVRRGVSRAARGVGTACAATLLVLALSLAGVARATPHIACSKPTSARLPCRFSTPSGNVRCEWTPASQSVECELLATRLAFRLHPTGKARRVRIRLTRRGETLPAGPYGLLFPQKLSCQATRVTMTCNQDEGFSFFEMRPRGSRSA